jgi:MFS transporter, FHS family, Na+ dependent glucose transporter 1
MSRSRRQTLAYFAAFFALGATIASLGPTLPFLARNTGASLAQLGLLFTMRSAGYLIGSLLGGRLYDHLPGHRLLGSAILMGGFGLALLPEMRVFTPLVLIMLLIGLAEATLDVGSNTQLVWVHGERSGPYLNGMFLFAGIGGTLSPLLLSTIGGSWGYRILALICLPIALWAFLTPSPPRQTQTENRPQAAFSPFQFATFCLLTFIFVGGEVGFSGWIYSYAFALNLGTEQTAGMLTSFYWLGITLGRVAAIFVAAHFKPGRIVLANLTGLVASLVLVLLNPASQSLLWIGSLGFGFFLAPVFPTTFAYLERKTPITGTAAGVLWASGSFGAMVYPWVMGLQMESAGPVSIMLTLAVSFGVSLVLFGWVSRK